MSAPKAEAAGLTGRPPDASKRCPKCDRVMFRTMTDYLCINGCGYYEPHREPIPRRDEDV